MKNRFGICYFFLSLVKTQFGGGVVSRNSRAIPTGPILLQVIIINSPKYKNQHLETGMMLVDPVNADSYRDHAGWLKL